MNAELAKQYREAKRRLQLEIDAFYTRYMNKFKVSYDEAVKDLTYKEQTDWLEGYRERAEQIAAKAPGYEKLIREQTQQSFGARISRLEARQAEIDLEVGKLGIGAQKTLSEGLTDIYEDGFYKSSFSLQQESGIGFDIEQLDSGTVQDIVDYPWSGASFSERIWRNTEQLKTELKNTLTQGLIRGDSADEMARKLAKRMDVSFSAAKRLVLTESAHIHNQAKLDAYKEAEVEEYQLIATLDKRTSEICREMDGKMFKVKDARAGENYPPFHPYCRTTTKAVFEGTETGERAARDEDGKTAYVPADMDYNEWYNQYVKDSKPRTNNPEQYQKTAEAIQREWNMLPEPLRKKLSEGVDAFEIIEDRPSYYDRKNKMVYILDDPEEGEVIHELGHALETLLDLYETPEFVKVLENGIDLDIAHQNIEERLYGDIWVDLLPPGEKFVSDYQRRVYEQDLTGRERINYQTYKFNVKVLGEYFAEGFRYYFTKPEYLKQKDPILYEFIEELIYNGQGRI